MTLPIDLPTREHKKFVEAGDETAVRILNASSLIPSAYDYLGLSYVAAGSNGAGEVETVTYKKGGASGTTVATLTLTYDATANITSVTRT